MTDMTELEWVARNVPAWAEDEDLKAHICADGESFIFAFGCAEECGTSKAQWLAERERLQNKPKWADAPEWAGHLAQDADGLWVWYPQEPLQFSDHWSHAISTSPNGQHCHSTSKGEVLGDWRDTLERRPVRIDSAENYAGQDDMHTSGENVDTGADASPHLNEVMQGQVGGDHYKKLGNYQPWEVLRHWLTPEEMRGYLKGEAIVYIAREGSKGGDEDIQKAIHTLQFLIEKGTGK